MLRALAAVLFVLAGLNHFRNPIFYQRIVPPGFPSRPLLVIISGIAEISGGIGLLIVPLRRAAGWGLIALLIAVFPANIYMAIAPETFSDLHFPIWALWVRLPLQVVFVAWVWYVALFRDRETPA
ncbi:MAG TPA: MauE/DoxX family redox-associated membrane protein [Tepidisphaeraceae bacterium]|nr:MauE/DoxX family redox-associated membrane protein [Tepidisphaeraceae bacterium]